MAAVHVLGSMNMDLVARVKRFPAPGETLAGADFRMIPGGKGLNQAVAAARSGATVHMTGAVGMDTPGTELLEFLEAEGVSVDGVARSAAEPTGTAMILVSASGENCIVVIPGANGDVIGHGMLPRLAAGDVLVAPFEVPDSAILEAFSAAKAVGALTVLNPAPARSCDPKIFPVTDLLVVNETELAFFSDQRAGEEMPIARVRDLSAALAERYAVDVLATLGGRGVVGCLGGKFYETPATLVEVLDTTAAGDTFVGALAACVSQGNSLAAALSYAVHAAAICVSRSGSASSIPTASEIRSLLAQESQPRML